MTTGAARNIGGMRHVVSVKMIDRTEDGYGGFAKDNPVKDPVRASIEPATSSEQYRYSQLQQIVTHKVTMRYRTDVKEGMLLGHDGRDLYIVAAYDPDQRKRFLVCMCREGGIT